MLSSSLPALEGALESSNGDANGDPKGLLPASELQLVLIEDIADPDRDTGLSTGLSLYGLGGPRALEGGSNISDEWANSGVPYTGKPPLDFPGKDFCGSSSLEELEEPGVVAPESELSDGDFTRRSPPLPELTVIWGGRRGAKDLSGAIMCNRGRVDYIQKKAIICGIDVLDWGS